MNRMYIQEGLKNACNQPSARIGESDLVHIFTNSFTGAQPPPLFAVAYGCFHATKAALSSCCDRDYLLKSKEQVTSVKHLYVQGPP